ncbi:P-loop containing nucleoside triphosphate hydrolase protein [Cladochytrium replicatum]|nr:P-loop containing nucleoside triphosphate hydrolase protein [Cladochytrium replicatum]
MMYRFTMLRSSISSDGGADPTTIQVAVRARPLNSREQFSSQFSAWKINNNTIFLTSPDGKTVPGTSPFVFDRIFGPDAKSVDIFQDVASNIVHGCIDGINGTIFAYGQTSSGKTYTMQGNNENPGIIPLSMYRVFQKIRETHNRQFLLRVSYVEIYNEIIRDLLAPENDNLKIREDVTKGVYLEAREEIVTSLKDIDEIMSKGDRNRHVGETNMNERSSRSHTIFQMIIESHLRTDSDEESKPVKISKLNLVDLAGSERAGHTGAEGIRLKEGGHINKSLLTLATVIGKLSEGGDKIHIPYRDSKLTRILQPSLGGNARTAIICNITTASSFVEETLGTLKFASRAKTIHNRPEVNEVISADVLLKRYRKQIEELQRQLKAQERKEQISDLESPTILADPAVYAKLAETLDDKNQLQERLEKLQKLILSSNQNHDDSSPRKRETLSRYGSSMVKRKRNEVLHKHMCSTSLG